jgi:nitrite reductase/ring-hydroxylating ferredoxin subunit
MTRSPEWRCSVAEHPAQPPKAIDPMIKSPGREGLTGTAPANLYATLPERESITTAPDRSPEDQQPAWRQDFPIDWPQDQYVERRDFMRFLVLTSAALSAGQLWIVGQNWLRRRRGLPAVRHVANLSQVPVGMSLVFAYPGELDNCVLVRLGDRDLVAYSQKCTHLSCAVIPEPEKGRLHCPCHEGFFDLRSGTPTAGPPRRPLPRITLEVRGQDVYATGVEVRTV